MNTRIEWIDVFKGLAILLVILGHAYSPFNSLIYLFHIPAFFFISGLTSIFSDSFSNFFYKKINVLIYPYLIANFIIIFLVWILKKIGVYGILLGEMSISNSLIEQINMVLSFSSTHPLAGATWFYLVLFFTQIFSWFIFNKLEKIFSGFNLKINVISIAVILLLFVKFSLHSGVFPRTISFHLDLIPYSFFYFSIGYLYRDYFVNKKKSFLFLVFLTFFIIVFRYFSSSIDLSINLSSRHFGQLPLAILSSLSFIMLLLEVSKFISSIDFIKLIMIKIQKSSLLIISYHFIFFKIFFHLYSFFSKDNIVPLFSVVPLTPYSPWAILTIFTIIFSLSLHKIISRFGLNKYFGI